MGVKGTRRAQNESCLCDGSRQRQRDAYPARCREDAQLRQGRTDRASARATLIPAERYQLLKRAASLTYGKPIAVPDEKLGFRAASDNVVKDVRKEKTNPYLSTAN